jgi:hypothetical protein
MIAIENLKTILFLSFKIGQLSKIASFFFCIESDKKFSMPTGFYFYIADFFFDFLDPKLWNFLPTKVYFFLLHVIFPIDYTPFPI